MTLSLQCSWPKGLDLDGLNPGDVLRIRKIGFAAWIKEVEKSTKPARRSLEYKQARLRARKSN